MNFRNLAGETIFLEKSFDLLYPMFWYDGHELTLGQLASLGWYPVKEGQS